MKNNVFQKMLIVIFAVATLLVANCVSAAEMGDRDWRPSGAEDTSADAFFNRVMNNPWKPIYSAYLKNNWGYLSINQQAQIVDRMVEQGLISHSQAQEANWIDLENGPEVTMGG